MSSGVIDRRISSEKGDHLALQKRKLKPPMSATAAS